MTDKIKEYPILFSAPMVRAILDGKKHMTRRPVKLKEGETIDASTCWAVHPTKGGRLLHCPYGPKGSHLWVRETWTLKIPVGASIHAERVPYYRADHDDQYIPPRWRPSIFMPRWASRLLLENLGVRIERVQDITEEDAIAEGVQAIGVGEVKRSAAWSARQDFANLWDAIHGKGAWARNDLVWVIGLKRIQEGAK